MACTKPSDLFRHECHHEKGVTHGGLLLPESFGLASGTPRTKDGRRCNGHGYASRLCRIYGVLLDHGRTSHSVWLLPWRVLHRTFHGSAWGSPETNTDAWVYLARRSSFLNSCRSLYRRMYQTCSGYDTLRYPMQPPPFGQRKSPHRISPVKAVPYLLGDYKDIIGQYWITMDFTVRATNHPPSSEPCGEGGRCCRSRSSFPQQSAPMF